MDSPRPSLCDIRALMLDSNKEILQSIKSLREDLDNLRTTIKSFDRRIAGIEESMSSFRKSQDKCEAEVNTLKSTVNEMKKSISDHKLEILKEVEMREHRRDNLIIYGLSEKEEGTMKERRVHNQLLLRDTSILAEIGTSNEDIHDFYRVGRITADKRRPIKLKMKKRSAKHEILNKAKNLKFSTNFKKIFIRNDLTKAQQLEQSDLQKELKSRREAGQDAVIYNGEVRLRESIRNFQI